MSKSYFTDLSVETCGGVIDSGAEYLPFSPAPAAAAVRAGNNRIARSRFISSDLSLKQWRDEWGGYLLGSSVLVVSNCFQQGGGRWVGVPALAGLRAKTG